MGIEGTGKDLLCNIPDFAIMDAGANGTPGP